MYRPWHSKGGNVDGSAESTRRGSKGGTIASAVQPEFANTRPAQYWHDAEAQRYHTTAHAPRVQAELTQSAVTLGDLPLGPGVVLDLGAGGGLSSVTFQALASASGHVGGPPFVLGVDTSSAMLAAATGKGALAGIHVAMPDGSSVDVSDGVQVLHARGDALLADLAQPLPLRSSVVDAVLSVSALQWLVDARPSATTSECGDRSRSSSTAMPFVEGTEIKDEGPASLGLVQPRLARLFSSLCSACTQGARIAAQFYPLKGNPDFGARALVHAARASNLSFAKVVLDFPHPKGGAKKWVFLAQAPAALPVATRNGDSLDLNDSGDKELGPWCALCWPVVSAHCILAGSDAKLGGKVRARVERQHAEVALRLARCGRRLLQTTTANSDDTTQVHEKLLATLTPLQLELAMALARLLFGEHRGFHGGIEEGLDVVGAVAERLQKCPRRCVSTSDDPRIAEDTSHPHTGAVAKPTLRDAVLARLPDVLAVLHSPPSERWRVPPAPREVSTAASMVMADV